MRMPDPIEWLNVPFDFLNENWKLVVLISIGVTILLVAWLVF